MKKIKNKKADVKITDNDEDAEEERDNADAEKKAKQCNDQSAATRGKG